jgi:dipeptidase
MSYGIYIGKNHTSDGIAYLGGYGDEPSSHWLEILPRQSHDDGTKIRIGVTAAADMPGIMTKIPQAPETFRTIRTSYSYYKGVPAPLTNGGLNEYGVAVRDIWSTSRRELIDMTSKEQTGPNYSDLARMVIEQAKTAREGVELIGRMIAKYGYSTYGGNSHLIADPDEAWVVIESAGSQGLWAAERLGADSIRASRPGYIGVIPVDQPDHPDFLYAPNLLSFAIEQGWYDPVKDDSFNHNQVYGDSKFRWAGVAWIEEEMKSRAARPEKISIEDVMWAVRTSRLTGDTAGYGQVVPLHHPAHDELRLLWHTPIGAIAAPFVPVFMGNFSVPEEFRQHRYLTTGESSKFEDTRHSSTNDTSSLSDVPQSIESTRSAVASCKRLLYLISQHHEAFLPEVTEIWEAVEQRLLSEHQGIRRSAEILLDQGESSLATDLLTYYSNNELLKGLDLVEALAASLEARTRALHGIRASGEPLSAEQIW